MKKKTKKGKMAKNREAVARAAEKKATKPNEVSTGRPIDTLAKRHAPAEHNGLMSLQQAKEHAEDGQYLATKAVQDWYALALHAITGLEHGGPQALGLSVTAWYGNLYRGAWQMVRRTVENVKRLKGVPMEELTQIPDCNAYTMSRLLPENLRNTKQWLDAAKSDTGEVFAEKVYGLRKELGFPDETMVKTDAVFKLKSIPASLGPLLNDCLKHAAAENELDLTKKEGRVDALQIIVSEYHLAHCVEVPEETGA